jgi:hypothetical protein
MTNIIHFVILAVLFFLLTPNILLRLPKNGSKFVVAGVHAIVFAVLYYVICILLKRFSVLRDGFRDKECKEGTEDDNGPFTLDNEGKCVALDPDITSTS